MGSNRISAVIFDLDGTILDTERATGGILKEFLAKYGKAVDPEKEEKRLGKMHKESAAAIVEDYELPMTADEYSKEIMPLYQEKWAQAKELPGANRLIRHLNKNGIPLALASNSIRKHIQMKLSHHQGWEESFSVILGSDNVSRGKPFPDIFLEAAKRLGVDPSNCIVFEDSPVGVRAAKASGGYVIAVPSLQSQPGYYSIANCVLHSLLEFQPELWGLPAFDDWIQKALPIEPLLIRSLRGEVAPNNGFTLAQIIADNGSYELVPDQVCGVFFGWAKLEMHGVFKVVVTIGWQISSGIARRVIQAYFIDKISISTMGRMHLLLVGYIRKLQNEDNMSEALKIVKEDEDVARAALELPLFSQHCSNPLLAEAIFN